MIAVVGGGAAGFFAAIKAASNGQKVVLLEAGNKLLAKVRVSGGGRCNVTNGAETLMNLLDGYPRGHKELRGPFTRFNNQHTMRWFEDRGVSLKTEPDGRVFPISDDSNSIVDCLLSEAKEYDVQVFVNHRVEKIIPFAEGFKLIIGDSAMEVDKVIVTTGGGRDLIAFRWLSELGLEIIDPVPSLFTFNIPQSPFKELMGVAIPDVEVTIMNSKFSNRGPVLVTHWGLSGPSVLKLSSLAARYLSEVSYGFSIKLDFLPDESFETVVVIFNDQKKKHPRQAVSSFRMEKFTARFWLRLIQLSGIPLELDWANVSKAQIVTLVNTVKKFQLQVQGKTTFKEEFVTSGGISLKEIDFKTMESKKIPGLYFAGEVLDIDGVTGGYNFQAAWTTAFIAGESAAGSN